MQELYAPVGLAEVHVAEAQVVEEIGIVGVLAEELLQVDAGLIELAGGDELEGAGEEGSEIANEDGRLFFNRIILNDSGDHVNGFVMHRSQHASFLQLIQ